MAKTKRSVLICPDNVLANCIDVKAVAAPITLEEMGVPASDITAGAITSTLTTASNEVQDNYDAATGGVVTVDFAALVAGGFDDDFEILIIDVTNGREAFPRRTFTAATPAALATAINNATLEAGDGKAYTATEVTNVVTVNMPDNVIARIAATDGATIATTTPAVLSTGYTVAEAKEYLLNALAPQYGRTNRIKFPVIEPDVTAALTTASASTAAWNLRVFTKVSEVRFDKNTGSSYQDVETFEILVPSAVVDNFQNVA